MRCVHLIALMLIETVTRSRYRRHRKLANHHAARPTLLAYYVPRRRGGGIKRYRDTSVYLSDGAAALGYRHAGCLQLSHRRPPEDRRTGCAKKVGRRLTTTILSNIDRF